MNTTSKFFVKYCLLALYLCSIKPVNAAFCGLTLAANEIIDAGGSVHNYEGWSGKVDITGYYPVMEKEKGLIMLPVSLLNTGWNVMGTGMGPNVICVTVSGTDVYVGGTFTNGGGVPNADYIARWDGSAWYALGNGLNAAVSDIAVSGNDVYAGGLFTDAGGNASADRIARWDGNTWNAMGTGANGQVNTVAIGDAGVFIGGSFTAVSGVANTGSIARWNGSTWNSVGGGLPNVVYEMDASGSDVYIAGAFLDAGGLIDGDRIIRWDGAAWHTLGTGVSGGFPVAVTIYGNDVYVGGGFTNAGGVNNTSRIARWDGSTWHSVGGGISNGGVNAIAVSGNNVFVGGDFLNAGGLTEGDRIARFDGVTWYEMDGGLSDEVNDVAVSGFDVYAGGLFLNAGGLADGDRIARWENAAVLPVELSGFQAILQENNVLLRWQTATERQNAGFHIQRSTDGKTWENIAFVSGNGDTHSVRRYEHLDSKPLAGKNYYRLQQVDIDGRFQYSAIKIVSFKSQLFRIAPNPVSSGSVQLFFPEKCSGAYRIDMYNNAGGHVKNQVGAFEENRNQEIVISTGEFEPGIYVIRVEVNGMVQTEELVIAH